jgi:hypothetical protein
MHSQKLAVFGLIVAVLAGTTSAADWITAPSYYTHDPQTGERVRQYTPIGPFYIAQRSDFLRSGYRHLRSSIQVGTNADHLHVVEQWGAPVRPYDEWRFPYRPYSVPYPLWGPMQFGWGVPHPWMFPDGTPGHTDPGHGDRPYDSRLPGSHPAPWWDGNYAPFRSPSLPDPLFFRPPTPDPPASPPADDP